MLPSVQLSPLKDFLSSLGALTIVFGLMMTAAGQRQTGWPRWRSVLIMIVGLGLCVVALGLR